jgi:hypothetical protein
MVCLWASYKKEKKKKKLIFLQPESQGRQESDPDSELDLDPEPDPLVRGADPRMRIHIKMSRIPNTAKNTHTLLPCDLKRYCWSS